jgi:dipeptidyl aminopeptidase/acylaminoacyl peptidase
MLERLIAALGVATLAECAGPSPSPSASAPAEPTSTPSSTPAVNAAATPSARIDISELSGRIAFSGGPFLDVDVYVVRADGNGLRRITHEPAAEFDPSWSPDGKQLAYRHQTGDDQTTDIYVVAADGSHALNLSGDDDSADWGPAWSPDGRWIAWNTSGGAA